MASIERRRNMADGIPESWRPPLMSSSAGPLGQLLAAVRRFLDLQNGSIWRDLAELLPQVQGTLVDVGCGAQPYRRLLGPQTHYLGIDTADAKAHFGYEMPDTLYYAGDTWPIAAASVDAVLCTETLEHVAAPAGFLAEAARCLRPGGLLLLTVPFAARWHFVPHDYWRYTPSGLKTLLDQAGFAEIRIYARGNACSVACYKVMALILPLLAAQGAGLLRGVLMRLLGLLLTPLLLALAVVANLSLHGEGGADCLGYTALASLRERE